MRAVVPDSFVPFMAAFPESAPRVAGNVRLPYLRSASARSRRKLAPADANLAKLMGRPQFVRNL